MEQNRGCHTINCPLPLFPADVRSNQKIFRRLRCHPFVPADNRNGKTRLQFRCELAHGLNRRTFASVQLQRQPQHHLSYLVGLNQGGNVGDIPIERAPLERLERLRRPPEFIAQGDTDPLRSVI